MHHTPEYSSCKSEQVWCQCNPKTCILLRIVYVNVYFVNEMSCIKGWRQIKDHGTSARITKPPI